MSRLPGEVICDLRVTFRAPLDYVYAWCTDYDPGDGIRSGGRWQRRVLERKKDRIVLEDLEDGPGGWVWRRSRVTLHPPREWRADSIGNYRNFRIRYRLRALGPETTELWFYGRRTPTELAGRGPSAAAVRRQIGLLWRRLGRSLEKDYAREANARRPRRGKR